jgi:hypothetical protein
MRARTAIWLALAAVGVLVVALVGIGVWSFRTMYESDPWTAVVVRAEPDDTCVQTFEGEDDGGFNPLQCFTAAELGPAFLDLAVGDCVAVNLHHPTLVIEGRLPCPTPPPRLKPARTTHP